MVIANPAAKGGAARLDAVVRRLAAHGAPAIVFRTERPGHAGQLLDAHAGNHDAVFALGGDGTVTEVLQAATRHNLPTGILPGGTGNLLAHSLRISRNPVHAVDQLLRGGERRIDLAVLASGQVFGFAAGIGVDASMVRDATRAAKRRLGVFAYVSSAARAALRFERFAVAATVDGVRHSFDAISVFVANFGDVFGGRILLGPSITPSDGLLDLCVFNPRGVRDLVRIAGRSLVHRMANARGMHFVRGAEIVVETSPPMPFQVDGDLVGATPLACRALPGAGRVLVPLP